MSATETESKPAQDQPQAPEITILTRVASIPMISSGIDTINCALSANAYTRTPYNTAKELSTTAYKLTEPLQVKLAPLIVRADGYANKAVDAVESRYPYPFKAQPEDVANYVRERKESATNYVHEQVNTVNKAVEDKIKTPALHVAQDIDQRFAPIVNYIEGAVSRFNQSEAGPSTPPDAQYQYQRALALSKTFRDNLTVYTSEQIKHIQEQSVLVQKASETAHTISATAASSLHTAQTRVLSLSDSMVNELQKVQDSTKAFAASLQTTLLDQKSSFQSQVPQIQQQLQQSYADLSAALSSTVNDLAVIIKDKDLPVQEKVGRLGSEVRDRVHPILEGVKKTISEVLNRAKVEAPAPQSDSAEKEGEPKANGDAHTNGNGHAPVEEKSEAPAEAQ